MLSDWLKKARLVLTGSYQDKHVGDNAVLEQLKSLGCDLEQEHDIRHYLYFPKKEDAASAASVLETEGYTVELEMGADNVNWLTLASHRMKPSEDSVAATRARMEDLAKSFNGVYDGWEAAVQPPI